MSRNAKNRRLKDQQPISQVRIIGGQFKRQWVPFIEAAGLRPTPDRLRETLFNWVQFELHDAKVLDVCAGSGVLGFEALSRGAAQVVFIEYQPNQAQLISQTAEKLKLVPSKYQLFTGNAVTILATLTPQIFDIVFIDPPYDANLWQPILLALIKHELINTQTLIYIEDRRPLSQTLEGFSIDYTSIKETKMGQVVASLIHMVM